MSSAGATGGTPAPSTASPAPEAGSRAPAVLIVDDDEQIAEILSRMLELQGYRCQTASSPAEARAYLETGPWNLVLSDLMMGQESGMSLLTHIRGRFPTLPVVMVSGVSDVTTATIALDLGAYGYVTKPFDRQQVLIATVNALRRARLEAENAAYRAGLETMVEDRTGELADAVRRLEESEAQVRASSEETVTSLTRAIEGRDVETGQHIERMSRYAALVARRYGLEDDHCELIRLASPMHDVGKIGVPDGILFKPGKLSVGEYEVIKQHPELGYEILAKSKQPLMAMAAVIARTHHERWDGTGYALGLAGTDIPLEGRIASVADVFDALVSRRVYKPAFPIERALEIMSAGRGTQFDGDVVEILLGCMDEALAIRDQYPDE